jgi:fibronectin-binding autotransporter adhesin
MNNLLGTTLQGGAGGAGRNGGNDDSSGNPASGGGGGGGEGGQGALITGATSNTNNGTISGGVGGTGGNSGTFINAFGRSNGGNGGDGGIGVQLTALAATLTNNGTITGGTGGFAGSALDPGGANGADGNGGAGVNGVSGDSVNNFGTISGGASRGSAGGVGVVGQGLTINNFSSGLITGGNSTSGAGGVGISGTGGTYVVDAGGIIQGGVGSGGLRANAIVFTNGGNTLELRAGFSIVGNVVAGSSDTLALGGSTNAPFNVSQIGAGAQYQGFGNYVKTGSSIWTLNNTTGAVTPWTIRQGILSISSDANLGNASGTVTLDGGTLQATATFSSNRSMTVTSNNGNIDVTGTNALTWGGVISGTGALTKTDTGTLVLTSNNSYAGGTTIAAGTLQLGNGGASGSIVGNVTDIGTLAFDRSETFTYGGVISGTCAFRQIVPGTLVLTFINSYAGTTTITAGTLQLGNGGASGSIVGNVTDNGTLAFDRSDAFTYGGVITGTGSVQQKGTGTTLMSGINTYTGTTSVTAGTLPLTNAHAYGEIDVDVRETGALPVDRN